MIKLLFKIFGTKINGATWVMLIVLLQDYIAKLDFTGMSVKEISLSILGFLIIVFRTFFNTPEKKLKELQAKAAEQGFNIGA